MKHIDPTQAQCTKISEASLNGPRGFEAIGLDGRSVVEVFTGPDFGCAYFEAK